MVEDSREIPIIRHHSKFIVLASTLNRHLNNRILANFYSISIVKLVIISEASGTIYMDHIDFTQPKPFKSVKNVFKSNREILSEGNFRVFAYHDPPRVLVSKGKVCSAIVQFLRIFETMDHLVIKLNLITTNGELSLKIKEIINKNQYEMTLNNIEVVGEKMEKLMTYEEKALCVLVPSPKKFGMVDVIFFKVR